MKGTKTFLVTLTNNVYKRFEITVPADVTMEEIDDWVDWHRERIFNTTDKSSLKDVEFPEEVIAQRYVNVSVKLDFKDEDIDFNRIVELKKGE